MMIYAHEMQSLLRSVKILLMFVSILVIRIKKTEMVLEKTQQRTSQKVKTFQAIFFEIVNDSMERLDLYKK